MNRNENSKKKYLVSIELVEMGRVSARNDPHLKGKCSSIRYNRNKMSRLMDQKVLGVDFTNTTFTSPTEIVSHTVKPSSNSRRDNRDSHYLTVGVRH